MQAGQKVRILMKSGLHFSGVVISEENQFLQIRDKYGKDVRLNNLEISILEVVT